MSIKKRENIVQGFTTRIKDMLYYLNCKISRCFDKLKNNKKQDNMGAAKIRASIFVWTMLLIPIVHFLIFWLYVNYSSILLGFQNVDNEGHLVWTFDNFKTVFSMFSTQGSTISLALSNTLKTWAFVNLFMFPLSVLWAYFIYKKIKWGSFYRVMFYIPSIISGVAIAAIFIYAIGADGPIGLLFTKITGNTRVPNFLGEEEYAMKTILVYIFWTGFGGNLVLLSGAMARIPREMIESAELEGAGMMKEIFSFVLPLTWPTLSTLIIISISGLFTASGPILLLTGGAANTYTISYWIFEQVNFGQSYYLPSALGLCFTLISLPIVLLIRFALSKVFADVEY